MLCDDLEGCDGGTGKQVQEGGICVYLWLTGEGNGNRLWYSCLENPMDGGAWQATVHGVAKSRTQLSHFTLWLIHVVVEQKPTQEQL